MKMILTILSLLALQSTATAASQEFGEVLKCQVRSFEGYRYSYMRPIIGDETTIDASQRQIRRLEFASGYFGKYGNAPLRKKYSPAFRSVMVYFQGELYRNTWASASMTVMVGMLLDNGGQPIYNSAGEPIYQGSIQTVTTAAESGLSSIDELKLDCQKAL